MSRSADLVVVETAPATAIAGQTLTYTVKVTNNGPSDAAGFTVTDTLPTGTRFVSTTTSDPSATCSNTSGQLVTCSSAGLINGAHVTWTIIVTIASNYPDAIAGAAPNLSNTAAITAATTNTFDPNLNNNTSTALVTGSRWLASPWASADFPSVAA